jgi:hypothetical protein
LNLRRTLVAVVSSSLLSVAIVAIGGAGMLACKTTNCDTGTDSHPFEDFKDGKVYQLDGGPIYESSPPDGTLLNFGQGAQIRVFHQLGGRPVHVELWVSFSPTGTNGGNLAQPAGNMAEVTKIDDEVIEIVNSTCGDYYLRVVASEPVIK